MSSCGAQLTFVADGRPLRDTYCSPQAAIDEGCFRQSGNIFEGAPDVIRILEIAHQIASAMDYLHAKVRCSTANASLHVQMPAAAVPSQSAVCRSPAVW